MPVARMENTCLIGRRWKPREGWSRPVLTGDGDIIILPLCGRGRIFCCVVVLMALSIVRWSRNDVVKRLFASVVRFPDRLRVPWPEPLLVGVSLVVVLRRSWPR